MKKQLLVIPVLLFATLMISSVFALTVLGPSDFSVSGSKEIKDGNTSLQVRTQVWHADGRPRFLSSISAQGQGYLIVTYEDKATKFLYRLNMNLVETSSSFDGNKVYGVVDMHGIEWARNLYQAQVWDFNKNYVYDRAAGTITFYDVWLPGVYGDNPIVIPVQSNK